ncbi:uncharacterized protein BKA78DRAFT_86376 [Phyllosticta capitalensis]|uniref:uncharacterized protein n=1 Tax=Phyllosticta capitalensis TaxID=121624 RepID=UPI00313214C3
MGSLLLLPIFNTCSTSTKIHSTHPITIMTEPHPLVKKKARCAHEYSPHAFLCYRVPRTCTGGGGPRSCGHQCTYSWPAWSTSTSRMPLSTERWMQRRGREATEQAESPAACPPLTHPSSRTNARTQPPGIRDG